MLGITELDELICRHLSQHDLAQCIRVSKRWCNIVSPSFWRDLSSLEDSTDFQQQAFGRLLLEDYFHEQQHQNLQEDQNSAKQHSPSSATPLRPLSTYGVWVRQLPHPSSLFSFLSSLCDSNQPQQGLIGLGVRPSAPDLIRHLYKRCPFIGAQYLYLCPEDFESTEFMKVVSEYVIPRACSLFIQTQCRELESWRLRDLLSGCSNVLERLTLDVTISYNDDETEKEHGLNGSKFGMGLKQLNLRSCMDGSATKTFWPWLWKQCGQVEHLEAFSAGGIGHSLAEGVLTYMPNLNKIYLENADWEVQDIASLLSGSRRGWKEVRMENLTEADASMKKALMKHCLTLEKLWLSGSDGITDHDKVQVLACCPNLREFTDICLEGNWLVRTSYLDVHNFIDLDPQTGSLKTWECESSLKVLKVKIVNIPRPEWEGEHVVEETYPGQGRKLQGQAYDRLARLKNLETLWLGGEKFYLNDSSCLEMSLASGLSKLSGLKALEELNLTGMRTEIGIKEVRWMAEQWPKLRAIRSQQIAQDKKVAKWLQRHHPEIAIKGF